MCVCVSWSHPQAIPVVHTKRTDMQLALQARIQTAMEHLSAVRAEMNEILSVFSNKSSCHQSRIKGISAFAILATQLLDIPFLRFCIGLRAVCLVPRTHWLPVRLSLFCKTPKQLHADNENRALLWRVNQHHLTLCNELETKGENLPELLLLFEFDLDE